jgi:hypothetical protein
LALDIIDIHRVGRVALAWRRRRGGNRRRGREVNGKRPLDCHAWRDGLANRRDGGFGVMGGCRLLLLNVVLLLLLLLRMGWLLLGLG